MTEALKPPSGPPRPKSSTQTDEGSTPLDLSGTDRESVEPRVNAYGATLTARQSPDRRARTTTVDAFAVTLAGTEHQPASIQIDAYGETIDGAQPPVNPERSVQVDGYGETLVSPAHRQASSKPTSNDQAVDARPAEPIPGWLAKWDRYEAIGLVGVGGMGTVYKAKDRRLGRMVALKFIRGDDRQLTDRFLQEARAQSRVDHPGVCKVHEVGEVEGKAYIAMQFVDGEVLHKVSPKLSLVENVGIIRDVSLALHAAHQLGIIHRDIKPANIMVEKRADGYFPIVMDFGLARESGESRGLTESGTVMGTPGFMSPEQARGEVRTLDCRTDVYSLGATLYSVLAGSPPFDDETVVNIILKVMNEQAPSLHQKVPSIPNAIDTIVDKCLSKEPQQRYQTARALAEDLTRFLEQKRIIGRKVGLLQRLVWRAKNNRPLAAAVLAFCLTLLGSLGYGARTYLQGVQKERMAKRQAELAQRLGAEMKDMEWLLRTARSMPIHDLNREKKIVRARMTALQTEFAGFGAAGRPLAHYALGRGHMGLHEYPEALKELEQAIAEGFVQGDAYYALGVVLGKHYEQAMYEARLAGGGDWAKRQLQEIEPKYLTPAIEALKQARAAKSVAPEYLEALIAFYQRDFDTTLKRAEVAQQAAPWLYEATKLQGDVHLERALQARDSGKYDEAEREFAAAVKQYTEAGAIGESDGEVFEGLAEAWVRTIEMAANRGQSTDAGYQSAVAASDKITMSEPNSITGHLKKSFAAMLTMGLVGIGKSSTERVQQCLRETEAVLERQPEHPYARDVAADCNLFASDLAQSKGDDPEPLLRKPMELLEPAVKRNPQFLWGLNDLATAYAALGVYLQSKGNAQAKQTFESSLMYAGRAMDLDAKYLTPIQNSLFLWARLISTANSESDLKQMIVRADELYSRCMKINDKYQMCNDNYLLVYARAAQRMMEGGLDPQAQLARAFGMQAQIAKLGGAFLDAEQYSALAHYVDASQKLKKRQSPGDALTEVEGALKRCFAQADKDAMCRTIAAQAEWVNAELQPDAKRKVSALKEAQRKAESATQSPEKTPEAWQVLAETHLRLARVDGVLPKDQESHISQGLTSVDRAMAINANHVPSRLTQGDLHLLRAQTQKTQESRRAAGLQAMQSYEQAMKLDPFLASMISPRLVTARGVAENR